MTAAHGNQGKLLIPRLLAAGAAVRACVRSDESAQALRAAGLTDIVAGDLSDSTVLARAMDGVEKVYYVGPALHPREREMGLAAVDAARAAGVQHFVFSSVLHAIITDLVQHEIKRDIEEYLLSSGLGFTILQPANYMLLRRLKPAFAEGIFFLSWALDRYQSMVDLGDVTEVAAAVLADSDRHAGATYELVAPGRYTARIRPGCHVRSASGTAVTILSGIPTFSPGCWAGSQRRLSSLPSRHSTTSELPSLDLTNEAKVSAVPGQT